MDSPDRYDPNNAKELLNSAKIKLDNYKKNNDEFVFIKIILNDLVKFIFFCLVYLVLIS